MTSTPQTACLALQGAQASLTTIRRRFRRRAVGRPVLVSRAGLGLGASAATCSARAASCASTASDLPRQADVAAQAPHRGALAPGISPDAGRPTTAEASGSSSCAARCLTTPITACRPRRRRRREPRAGSEISATLCSGSTSVLTGLRSALLGRSVRKTPMSQSPASRRVSAISATSDTSTGSSATRGAVTVSARQRMPLAMRRVRSSGRRGRGPGRSRRTRPGLRPGRAAGSCRSCPRRAASDTTHPAAR